LIMMSSLDYLKIKHSRVAAGATLKGWTRSAKWSPTQTSVSNPISDEIARQRPNR
jgi:hypothetical protein